MTSSTHRAHQGKRRHGLSRYRNITQYIALLTPAEAATFMALAQKSDYTTYHSAVCEQTLADMLQIDVSTVRRHIARMGSARLVRHHTETLPGGHRKNHYQLATRHYCRIDVERLLSMHLPLRHKGFATQLKTMCHNATNQCLLPATEIARHLDMARHTAETYLHDLCQTGLLMRTERGYELTRTDIFDPGQLSAEERLRLFFPPRGRTLRHQGTKGPCTAQPVAHPSPSRQGYLHHVSRPSFRLPRREIHTQTDRYTQPPRGRYGGEKKSISINTMPTVF